MSDKTLGYLLSKTKPGKNKAASKLLLLKDNPYSQALMALKGKGDFTNKNIHYKYDWFQPGSSRSYPHLEDVLNIGFIDLSRKKKKKKKKTHRLKSAHAKDSNLTTMSDLKEKIMEQEDSSDTKVEVVKASGKKKSQKKKKSKKKAHHENNSDLADIDDYTSWINLISGIDSFEYAVSGKKKRKKKKKKAKSLLLKKIDQSNKVKDNILSEQLAELYVQQGHKEKAIEMYTKLSLKNPEKSAFFAPLIEELKKKQ